MKPARIFLFIVAFLTFAVVAGFLALRVFSDKLTEIAFVPTGKFEVQQPLQANAYENASMWFSRPGTGVPDPARWAPQYQKGASGGPEEGPPPPYAVFFVHPTSYLDKAAWNAPLGDATANDLAKLFLKGMASPFNRASQIWAPRYRQAAIGAFLVDDPAANEALDAAYRDVEQSFVYFLNHTPRDMPIVLAGHSQGSLHLLRLLASRVADSPIEQRIAAVYAIGWPVSLEHDLPKLGLPACKTRDDAGCIVSWVSFAEPAETAQMLRRYDTSPGFDGKPRGNSPILCTNPISGRMNAAAEAKDNRGTLVPNIDLSDGELVPQMVPAHCNAKGILLIGPAPAMGAAVLPGNNYHVYDIPLFWRNLQLDVAHRVSLWGENPLIATHAADFRAALPEGGGLMALDIGTKTIGTAFCDTRWSFATAGTTLLRGKFSADKAKLEALVAQRSIKGIVIGLPLNMDGSEGPRAQASRAYARNLAPLGLPVLLWDERWSTASAERDMIAQDMSRGKRAERIDSHAAAVILQGAIDALAGAAF